jgi:hypothetical protein
MVIFLRRLIGALVLDPATYEDVEADRGAGIQSMAVVVLACVSGGLAAMGEGLVGLGGFVTGSLVALGAWLVWVSVITTVGTVTLAEAQTRSNVRELLRTLSFATAPAVFLAFAAMRPAAPIVLMVVTVWMTAAAIIAVRQALDYRSTMRAVAVCGLGLLVTFGVMFAVSMVFSQRVS